MSGEKKNLENNQDIRSTSGLTRREFVIGTGAGFVTLSLGNLLFSSRSMAAQPKKGGKLVYAGGYINTKHKSLKNAMHPYYGIEIRTRNTYDALTRLDEDLNVLPEIATAWEPNEGQDIWEITIREELLHRCKFFSKGAVIGSQNFVEKVIDQLKTKHFWPETKHRKRERHAQSTNYSVNTQPLCTLKPTQLE